MIDDALNNIENKYAEDGEGADMMKDKQLDSDSEKLMELKESNPEVFAQIMELISSKLGMGAEGAEGAEDGMEEEEDMGTEGEAM